MELRQIRYFLEVAKSGSFNEAASRLRISQSSLSRRVRDLETELGTRLLDRDTRGARPTNAGLTFLARATALMRDLDIARDEVMAHSAMPRGEVTIGTSSTFSRTLLGDVAEAFDADYPRIRLHFVIGAQYALYEAIGAGRVDLAVMISPDPMRNCIIEPLVEEQLHLVSSSKSTLPHGPVPVSALSGLPLVMFPRPTGIRTVLDQAAAAADTVFNVRYELADVSAQLDFVHRGLCHGIMSKSSIRDNKGRRTLHSVPIEGLTITRALVSRAGHHQLPAISAVADRIRTVLRKLVTDRHPSGDIDETRHQDR
jgi:LysR family nitrogen assimilation transcriptional regulator